MTDSVVGVGTSDVGVGVTRTVTYIICGVGVSDAGVVDAVLVHPDTRVIETRNVKHRMIAFFLIVDRILMVCD
jgi:hypothetical protein